MDIKILRRFLLLRRTTPETPGIPETNPEIPETKVIKHSCLLMVLHA